MYPSQTEIRYKWIALRVLNSYNQVIPSTFRVLLFDQSRNVEDLDRPTDHLPVICSWITGKGLIKQYQKILIAKPGISLRLFLFYFIYLFFFFAGLGIYMVI